MKQLLFLISISLLFACNKSNNNNTPAIGSELPYIIVGQNAGAGHDSIVFHYDYQNRIISYVRPLEYDSVTLQYDANGNIVSENEYSLSSPVHLEGTTSYLYGGSLITATTTYPSSTEKYTLNTLGQLSIYDPVVAEKGQYYYDANGNVIKVEYSHSSCNGICYTNIYSYDSKNGMFSEVKTSRWWLLEKFDFSNLETCTGIVNNVIQENDTYFTNNTTEAFKYTLTYDVAGYPITVKDDKGGIDYTIKYIAVK